MHSTDNWVGGLIRGHTATTTVWWRMWGSVHYTKTALVGRERDGGIDRQDTERGGLPAEEE